MSFRDFQSCGTTRVSEHVTYTPDAAHCVFRYDDFMGTMKVSGKRMDVLVLESTGLPMGDSWLVELKDYRRLTRRPNPENSIGLPMTVGRKIADTHRFLESAACPPKLSADYRSCSRVHFCLHMELPAQKNVAPPFLGDYRALVSLAAGLSSGRLAIPTPNHSRVELLNADIINRSKTYPWSVELD